jgi:hypothetical protein
VRALPDRQHQIANIPARLTVVQFFMGLSIVVAASRQFWAFSRDGALPFSSCKYIVTKFLQPEADIYLQSFALL